MTILYAPNANQQFTARDGSSYVSNANKVVVPTPTPGDIVDLLNLGCKFNPLYIRAFGTVVVNGVTAVPITDAGVSATDLYQFSLNTVGGTVGAQPHVSTLVASTSVTVVATASDTSTYNYFVWSQG